MGIIFSLCIRRHSYEEIEDNIPLLREYYCFVCNETFSDNIKYNRHIPKCSMINKGTLKNKK